jgi:N,N'-diacetyllegionaminate synthase
MPWFWGPAGIEVVVMVGFQGYPTPDDENQISRIGRVVQRLAARPNVSVGFADHSLPQSEWVLAFSAMALGQGARVFEKHLTLGEVMKLEDHEAAINPDKFAQYERGLRACAAALRRVRQAITP